MSTIRSLVKEYGSNAYYFHSYLGYRIFVVLGLSLFVGLMDGFGLAMFLPMLEMVSEGGNASSTNNMGNLSFLIDLIIWIGGELTLEVVLLIMMVFFSLKGVFKFLEQFAKITYKQFFIRRIREKNLLALANLSYANFTDSDAGRIQNTMTGEVEKVVKGFMTFMLLLQQFVLLGVYASLAVLANPGFAVLVGVGGVITNFFFSGIYRLTKRLSTKLTSDNHNFQNLILQLVSQFKYLKATGLTQVYAKKLIKKIYVIEHSQKKIGVLGAIVAGVREPLMVGVVVIVILLEVRVFQGQLGPIILSILFFYRALGSVLLLQNSWNTYLSVSGSLDNIQEFSNELSAGAEKTGVKSFFPFQRGIEIKNLEFSYSEAPVLRDVNIEIRKNQFIAFVGESGSGKTTLLNLVAGLLKPLRGRILVDSEDLSEFDISTYQRRLGYITQEPVIFNDTIYNNVTFWDQETEHNLQKFRMALELVHLDDLVFNTLPDQEYSTLGYNGVNLSGGQKQRVSIAREIYKEVDLLLMDEATSSLDLLTEKEIQNNIDLLKGKFTVIVVAHRLSTIKNADTIYVIKDGKVEATGSYNDLAERSPYFNSMVKLQK